MEVYGYDPYVSVDLAYGDFREQHPIIMLKTAHEIYKECDYIHDSCSGTGRYKGYDQ